VQVLHIVREPGGECCDFCTAGPVFKTYACHDFMWNKQAAFAHESIGTWAACKRCGTLIDADRWASLTDRAVRKFVRTKDLPHHEVSTVRARLTEIHELFRKHMIRES
jgi:hypothetical protein